MGAREYDPRTGRWLQRDPSDGESGDPNPYQFCGNDPVNLLDPDGEDWVDFIPIIGSGRDLLEGIREGDWSKIALGVGGLALDLTTGGVGGLVKGAAKGLVKSAVRQGAKKIAAGSCKRAVQQGTRAAATVGGKGTAKSATRKTVKHHIMTNKNYKRGNRWSNQFENTLKDCNAQHFLNDPANLVELPEEEHRKRAPHSNAYHQSVWDKVKKIVEKRRKGEITDEECQRLLKELLAKIGELLKKHPDALKEGIDKFWGK